MGQYSLAAQKTFGGKRVTSTIMLIYLHFQSKERGGSCGLCQGKLIENRSVEAEFPVERAPLLDASR